MAESVYLHVIFSGRVQGVGFRATTARIAQKFEVEGFVQNLDDGTVRMEAEGGGEELRAFQNAIRCSRLGSLISGEEVVRGVATGRFRGAGFRIQVW